MMNKAKKYKLKLDYTEEELKELKRLSKDYHSPMTAVWRVAESVDCNNPFRNLRTKYKILDIYKELDLMVDINNVVMGTAIFLEKKYVVHDKITDQCIYYNMEQSGLRWGKLQSQTPEKKTKEEWLAINSAYEPMLESVEDDE